MRKGGRAPAGLTGSPARATWPLESYARRAFGTSCCGQRVARRNPAIHVRSSRSCGTVQHGPVQRQETQIVQSCMTLEDFLPGFGPLALRPERKGSEGDEPGSTSHPLILRASRI